MVAEWMQGVTGDEVGGLVSIVISDSTPCQLRRGRGRWRL